MEEGFIFPRGFASKFRLAHSIAQNIPNNFWTVIHWDTQEFDVLDEAAIINPWAFTPKQAGYYFLYASFQTNLLLLGNTLEIRFRNTGVVNVGNRSIGAGFNNEVLIPSISVIHYLTPNDTIDVQARHNLGAAALLGGNRYTCMFFGYRIG